MTTQPSGGVSRAGSRGAGWLDGGPVTPAERNARTVATYYARREEIDDDPETAYERVLPLARWAVLQRLLRGLLRERPDGLPDPVLCDRERPAGLDRVVEQLPRLDPAAVHARVEAMPLDCAMLALLPFPDASTLLVVPVRAVHGFDRFRLDSPAASVTPRGGSRVTHPTEVVTLLAREGAFPDEARTDAFREEIEGSVANVGLALLADRRLAETIQADPWAADSTAPLERFAAVTAHPVHPCAKTRLGMTAVESLSYAAEFSDRIDLRFVAVARDRLVEPTAAGRTPFPDALAASVDGLEAALERAVPPGAAGDYRVLPVHPWQYQHVLPSLLEGPTGDHVVPLSGFTAPATPLGNLRTVVPHAGEGRGRPPHVKLPVDVLKTSHWRTLPPAEVHDGPAITDLLRAIGPLETVAFLDEPAAACFEPTRQDDAISRQLAALYRQPPRDHPVVDADDALVPVTSLLAPRPGGRSPLLVPIVERYANATGGDAAAFLDEYVAVLVPDVLRLVAEYGVGPEVHQQNTLVAFGRDGRPRHALVRDFGGFRIDRRRLARRGFDLELYPGSGVDAESDGLYEAYAELFQVHLGELVVALVRHCGLDEATAWARIRRRCEAAFDRLRADPAVPDGHVDCDEAQLFATRAPRRGWTSMRLAGAEHDPIYAAVANPLAGDAWSAGWDRA